MDTETHIETQVDPFLVDRRAQRKSEGTLGFYIQKPAPFEEYCDAQGITATTQMTATLIRNFILWLQQRGHNKDRAHAFYGTPRTVLYWWEEEYEPEGCGRTPSGRGDRGVVMECFIVTE